MEEKKRSPTKMSKFNSWRKYWNFENSSQKYFKNHFFLIKKNATACTFHNIFQKKHKKCEKTIFSWKKYVFVASAYAVFSFCKKWKSRFTSNSSLKKHRNTEYSMLFIAFTSRYFIKLRFFIFIKSPQSPLRIAQRINIIVKNTIYFVAHDISQTV